MPTKFKYEFTGTVQEAGTYIEEGDRRGYRCVDRIVNQGEIHAFEDLIGFIEHDGDNDAVYEWELIFEKRED
ncbi:MAG: hypothetical protein H7A35_00630 [Planctomycetales bacterium]|nr:hypothetical protein [bacterium]UNM08568.1 MAG: hypothetical protein H7A35_00630 [Planctomycetales bacterium]